MFERTETEVRAAYVEFQRRFDTALRELQECAKGMTDGDLPAIATRVEILRAIVWTFEWLGGDETIMEAVR